MKKFKSIAIKVIAVSIICLVISGCAPTYNLAPEYNKDTKTIKISELILDNVVFYKKKDTKMNDRSMNNIKKYREEFKLKDNKECKRLSVKVRQAYNNWYFHDSMLESIMLRYDNNCEIEKISNLNFGICKKTKTITTDDGKETTKEIIDYGVTESKTNQYGYDSGTLINLGTKDWRV